MTDFNNFFEDSDSGDYGHTPVYHTPEPKHKKNTNLPLIISICAAVIMCVVVIVNVVVLASLKNTVADEYAQDIAAKMNEQYKQAIEDSLKDKDVIEQITDNATKNALDALNSGVGDVAAKYSPCVARLYMYTRVVENLVPKLKKTSLATAFLVTDYDGVEGRYMVTNAHCVKYYDSSSLMGKWTYYDKITCQFDNEEETYTLKVVACGDYSDSEAEIQNLKNPDLALLQIEGKQPDNQLHPSLKVLQSDDDIKVGASIALIGNPEGIGNGNSVTTGCVSQKDISIGSWGPGTFIMTDAAINEGNSGGPMINSMGVVVGVVESKLVDEKIDNMGFALSAETLYNFIMQAQSEKHITVNITWL